MEITDLDIKKDFFSGKAFYINLLIGIFLREFHLPIKRAYLTTLLTVRTIFPARKIYFNLNVLICCLYSVPW